MFFSVLIFTFVSKFRVKVISIQIQVILSYYCILDFCIDHKFLNMFYDIFWEKHVFRNNYF